MTVELLTEVVRLLRTLAGPECACRVCLDARIAADQIDRHLMTIGGRP